MLGIISQNNFKHTGVVGFAVHGKMKNVPESNVQGAGLPYV
jgi:hypothetical protein